MSRAVIHRHAPHAEALGIARLADHCFIVTGDGYASVEPSAGRNVHGVLWRLTLRDRVTLDAWKGIVAGTYRAEYLRVCLQGRAVSRTALVYRARPGPIGAPRVGYMELVIAAAQEWALPLDYIASLRRWLPGAEGRAATQKRREFRWR